MLTQLANAGGSGGAKPKAQLYLDPNNLKQATTTLPRNNPKSDSSNPGNPHDPWLVKFSSASLPLAHEEHLCEAIYLTLAKQAGNDVPEWQLLPGPKESRAKAWLAV